MADHQIQKVTENRESDVVIASESSAGTFSYFVT
jgi:hypothetical protein